MEETLADNAYDGLGKPLMATGGTRDVGRVDPGDLTPGEWRTLVYRLAPPGDKYAVITEVRIITWAVLSAMRSGAATLTRVALRLWPP
jgi:hypothetical protein